MPYFVDLEKRANKLMHLSVKPHGWIHNGDGVQIEFGVVWLDAQDPEPSMCMRVKGTTHVWAWFQHTFNQMAKDNYADFFTKQLEEFRIEFLLWIHSPVYSRCKWVGEYYEMFKGRFYDFSKEEQEEVHRCKSEWESDQQAIKDFADRIGQRQMYHKQNRVEEI